jgi:hypothetical protein
MVVESLVILLIVLWVVSGLIAAIMSLVCFGYKGSTLDKVVGLLIAIFLGPLYWFYYAFNGAYCLKNV